MQTLQTQPLRQPKFATKSDLGRTSIAHCVRAFFAAIIERFSHAEHDVSTRLGGHAWTDSLEREINNDVAMCRRLRF